MSSDIRSLIREVLAEELKALRSESQGASTASEDKVESISISSDADLNSFAKRVLSLADNENARADIKSGRMRFQLAAHHSSNVQRAAPAGEVVSFDKGLISEKKIAGLADGSTIEVTKAVCFTPLALDEIRRKRICVERIKK